MCHLQGAAFDFYYEQFVQDGSLTEDAEEYVNGKKKLLTEFAKIEKPKKEAHKASPA